jgi:hypothetical protein
MEVEKSVPYRKLVISSHKEKHCFLATEKEKG